MAEKILDYRTCSSPNIAHKFIGYFENKYHCEYRWGHSYGEIEEAIAVCVLEMEDGDRCVTTTSRMKYIESRKVVKEIDIGGL